MRTPEEQQLALGCLQMAMGDVEHAKEMLAFVLGDESEQVAAPASNERGGSGTEAD